MKLQTNQAGLTIIELLAAIIISTLMVGLITTFTYTYWRGSTTLQADQETLGGRMDAGDYIRDALDSSSGLINQNDISDLHTGAPDPADVSGTHWEIIHAIPGTVNATNGTIQPLIYFARPSLDSSKNFIMNGVQPYQDNVVFYLNGTTKQFLARTLANPNAVGNAAVNTCPPGQITNTCPSDHIIASEVSSIDVRYFSRSGNPIDWTSIVATDSNGDPVTPTEYIGPDFPSVEVVEFNIHLYRKAAVNGGNNTINQTVIRVALRN